MTLVVARQVNNEIYIVGDTKFTANESSSWPEPKKYIGGLKVILLNPGLCVSFAGNIEIARDAIQGIYDKNVNLFNKNCAIEYFLEHHKYSVQNCSTTDFLIASIVECDEKPGAFLKEIFRIADSKVYCENEAAYIGDEEAFNYFQEAFHCGHQNNSVPTFEIYKLGSRKRPGFDQSLSTAIFAMQGVIDNLAILSVDGIRTVVISEEDQFKYAEYIQLRGAPTPVNNEPAAPVNFGDAAEGSDHKHVGILSKEGHGIYPFYSITGRFGVIYHPEECFEPTIIPNCTLEEFQMMVDRRINLAHQRAINYQIRF